MTSRLRNFCFTWNNYDSSSLEKLKTLPYKYLIVGYETGESGTPHLQGYIELDRKLAFGKVKKLHPKLHIEVRKGTPAQAATYCKKDGEFEEFGTLSRSGKRTDLDAIAALCKTGATVKEVASAHPAQFIRYHRGITALVGLQAERRSFQTEVLWFHGGTGTGKSHTAFEMAPKAYFKDMSDGKWWDGYSGEHTVIFEDMRKDTFKFHELLRLFDRYPLSIQFKGGSTEFRSKRIIVTTTMEPEMMYDNREDVGQLIRRISETRFFGDVYEKCPVVDC